MNDPHLRWLNASVRSTAHLFCLIGNIGARRRVLTRCYERYSQSALLLSALARVSKKNKKAAKNRYSPIQDPRSYRWSERTKEYEACALTLCKYVSCLVRNDVERLRDQR